MTKQKKGMILVLSTAVISGFSIFINAIQVKMIDPSAFTFVKNAIVGIFLFGIILALKKWKELRSLNKKQWLSLILIGFVGGAVPFLLFFQGLSMTGGTTGAFIHKTMFLFVAILAPLFLKEKINGWVFPAALILLASNFLLIGADFKNLGIGHLMILMATILWSIENVYSKHVLKNVSGTVLAFGRMFFGSLFLLLYVVPTGGLNAMTAMSGEQWLWTIVSTALLAGYVLTWYNGLKNVPVSLATTILLLGSIVTTLLSSIFLQKTFNLNNVEGLMLAVLGVMVWGYFAQPLLHGKAKRAAA
jgi:drug/metabolite transporter (DMT)-like permease